MRIIIRDIIISALIALALYFGFEFTIQQFAVHQISMAPTLEEGQRIFVNKTAYISHGPERGDIIVFKRSPQSTSETPLIKRVIGLPGEVVEIKSGIVYIDGYPLQEPYILNQPRYVLNELTIPEKNYFVLGDNRNNSKDSHEGWTVPEANIIGEAWVSIWPPRTWGAIPNYAYAYK
jgi:signal peptidase I